MIQTSLELIHLALELLMLLLQVVQLGLQRQQMHLHRTRSLLPFRLGKWEAPGGGVSLGGGCHHSYPWTLWWMPIGHNIQTNL